MLNKKILIFLGLLIFFFSGNIFAFKPLETEWGIDYKMVPRNPSPGDNVSINVTSYAMDLETSNISYIINGQLKKGGTGIRSFNFKVPNNNKILNLEIVAENFNGKRDSKIITIKPVSVDLVYEVVNPYRPVFYKGKSVAQSQSEVKFFAFPNFKNSMGQEVDKKTLIYSWKWNKKYLPSESGIGKDVLHLNKIYGIPKETKIEVNVRSLDGTMSATKILILRPRLSSIDFYTENISMPFNFKSVGKPILVSDFLDNDIIAVPYFFNEINFSQVRWTINNNRINLLPGADKLKMNIVKNSENVGVDLDIGLEIENEWRPLQAASVRRIFKSSQALKYKYRDTDSDNSNNIKNKEEESTNFFGL